MPNSSSCRKTREKYFPSVRQVNQNDVKRQKQNQIYDRLLKQNLNGPKGLTWRLHYKLEQIDQDERQLDRNLQKFPRISIGKKTTKSSSESFTPANRYISPYKRLFWLEIYQQKQTDRR